MLQQVVITTNDRQLLKPLLRSAIEDELKTLNFGLERTRKRLADFERQFSLSSNEFERRLNARELEETSAFTDWRMELGALRVLEAQAQVLSEARLD
jgi:hypothetical protein